MSCYKVDFESLPWETPVEGVRHKLFLQGGRRLRLVEYSKAMPVHWCDKGHMGYVLKGEMEIRFEDEVQTVTQGDGLCIPDGPEHRHQARVLTDTVTAIFVEAL